MKTEKEIMLNDLNNAKEELERQKEHLRWYMESEIDTNYFERNMIYNLIYMMELKEKIKTLELYIQLKD